MKIENLANRIILENRPVKIFFMDRQEAEKTYGKSLGVTDVTPSGRVRVVEVEGWDVALCCGTHVSSTAEIGVIKILDRFRLKKGVERIEFAAGEYAYRYYEKAVKDLDEISKILKTSPAEALQQIEKLLEKKKELEEEVEKLKEKLAEAEATNLLKEVKPFGKFKFLSKEMENVEAKDLKRIAFSLTRKEPWLVLVLGSKKDDKAFIVGAAGEKAVEGGVEMNELMKGIAEMIGGGGGTPRLAQAGGRRIEMFEKALSKYVENVISKLKELSK